MANYATRLDRLETARRPAAEPMRILVSFIDPQSHESVGMVAMETDGEHRHFDRAAGPGGDEHPFGRHRTRLSAGCTKRWDGTRMANYDARLQSAAMWAS
jgi:hypothetical protein